MASHFLLQWILCSNPSFITCFAGWFSTVQTLNEHPCDLKPLHHYNVTIYERYTRYKSNKQPFFSGYIPVAGVTCACLWLWVAFMSKKNFARMWFFSHPKRSKLAPTLLVLLQATSWNHFLWFPLQKSRCGFYFLISANNERRKVRIKLSFLKLRFPFSFSQFCFILSYEIW